MRYYLILLLSFFIVSCNESNEYHEKETINTKLYITNVNKAKYSKVQGYVYYHEMKLLVDNGNTGYYYKDYNLKNGDVIDIDITVYQKWYYTTNPYSDDLILSTSDINVSKYELKN